MKTPASLFAAALLVAPTLAPAQQTRGQNDPAIREMQTERANPGVTPGVQSQRQAAGQVDASGVDDVLGLLREAERDIRANRLGPANEALERASTRMLTRSTLASRADEPVERGPVARVAAAREALVRRDAAAALREVEQAVAGVERARLRPAEAAPVAVPAPAPAPVLVPAPPGSVVIIR